MSARITTVIFNGACPVCAYEIGLYRRYCERRDLPVRFADLNRADIAAFGLSADEAARRLHVVRDGAVFVGLPAFVALWQAMPGFRWLARLACLPLIRPALSAFYDRIFAPLIYRWYASRQCRLGNPLSGR